jgi:CDP-paratose synthetase
MSVLPNILLTGATGFLGSHLLEALLEKGCKVIILKRSTSNPWRILHLLDQVSSYDVDKQPLELAFEQQNIDVAIHTAGQYGRDDCSISKIIEANVIFGVNLMDACLRHNVKTFINTDTMLLPYLNNYSLSKKQFVEWLKQHSDRIQVVNLRLDHMYGVKDDDNKFVAWILSQLKENTPKIKLTPGEQKRDFIYIDDVVSAFMIALDKRRGLPKFCEFDVGTGQLVSVRKFVERMAFYYKKSNPKLQTKLLFGAVPYRKGEAMSVNVDTTGLNKIGWQSKIELDEGINKIIKE